MADGASFARAAVWYHVTGLDLVQEPEEKEEGNVASRYHGEEAPVICPWVVRNSLLLDVNALEHLPHGVRLGAIRRANVLPWEHLSDNKLVVFYIFFQNLLHRIRVTLKVEQRPRVTRERRARRVAIQIEAVGAGEVERLIQHWVAIDDLQYEAEDKEEDRKEYSQTQLAHGVADLVEKHVDEEAREGRNAGNICRPISPVVIILIELLVREEYADKPARLSPDLLEFVDRVPVADEVDCADGQSLRIEDDAPDPRVSALLHILILEAVVPFLAIGTLKLLLVDHLHAGAHEKDTKGRCREQERPEVQQEHTVTEVNVKVQQRDHEERYEQYEP